MSQINLLAGGAAYGLVTQLKGRFAADTNCAIAGTYSAVGAMRDQLLAGTPCDVVILTAALISQLELGGHVQAGSAHALGRVKTGVAVQAGAPVPRVATADELKAALLAAKGIYFPDPVKATAGIHFMNVLKKLGIDGTLADRLRPYPNGATAMAEMAKSSEIGLIGCTQITEIMYTAGVQLVAPLPDEFELATVYTAAVSANAESPQAAAVLVALLAGPEAAALRVAGGFEP
jgi:molybdate transport system substrate-binding protein